MSVLNKILIIDDEEELVDIIKEYLNIYNYDVKTALSYKEALSYINSDIELILLDIMIPKVDGFEICINIRERTSCPIIFFSAKESEEDKVKALSIGGDDYITKPISLRELKARIDSHLRREERTIHKNNKEVTNGNITIELLSKIVICNGQVLNLTRKEYGIIELLLLNKGVVITKETIFEKIWGYNCESDVETVTEHVKNIRKKIKKYDKKNNYIQTVWGFGYKWEITHV
ncbi:response regulator transcription factor [Hathewaya histolytica]|uniref:response regulator transcription factor n=1 Tax=Hathewaya histolytica TaxID=1498 RepID=UPI003B67707F